jgi:hypothetical protein
MFWSSTLYDSGSIGYMLYLYNPDYSAQQILSAQYGATMRCVRQ